MAIGIVLTGAETLVAGRTVPRQRIVNDGPPENAHACERENFAVVGPLTERERRLSPKKVRDVKPTYPELPPGTQVRGMWIGEIHLDVHGKVANLRTVRPVQLTPPFPAFNKAIVDAVRHWQFEPFVVRGKARTFCMFVTVKVDRR